MQSYLDSWFNASVCFRYDSLTGVPNIQKTMTFEKGCILFNIGALYTQMACKQVSINQNCVCVFYLADKSV